MTAAVTIAAAAVLVLVAYGVRRGVDAALGESLLAQAIAVGAALAAGGVVYAALMLRSGLPEVEQVRALVTARVRRARER